MDGSDVKINTLSFLFRFPRHRHSYHQKACLDWSSSQFGLQIEL